MKHRISVLFSASMLSLLGLTACGGGGGLYGSSSGSNGNGMGSSSIITNIVISPTSTSITTSGMQQYTAVAKDMNGNTVTGASLTWMSSNPGVATVNSSGVATGKTAGTTTITASISYTSSGGIYSGGGNPITYTSNMATLTVTTMDAVTGTAAMGEAFSNALVILKDANGQVQTGMTDSQGHFDLSTAGLRAPFLIKAEDNQGRTLFGMRADGGVANITPITDLMTRALFAAQGVSAEAAFTDPARYPAPNAESLRQLDSGLVEALRPALRSQGLDPLTFSFVSTRFDANGLGADRLLDNIAVNTSQGKLALDDRLDGRRIAFGMNAGMPSLEISALAR